jgi:hypothetical protein
MHGLHDLRILIASALVVGGKRVWLSRGVLGTGQKNLYDLDPRQNGAADLAKPWQ